MVRAIALRLLGVVPVLFLVTLVLFVLLRLAPGDAADLLVPDDASEEEVARIRERWGLDKPILEQYWRFLLASLRLDFGRSYRYGADVFGLIVERTSRDDRTRAHRSHARGDRRHPARHRRRAAQGLGARRRDFRVRHRRR